MKLHAIALAVLVGSGSWAADGRRILQEARQARSRGDVAVAEQKYREALPNLKGDYTGIVECLQTLGQLAESQQHLAQAEEAYRVLVDVQQNPNLAPTARLDALENLSRVYSRERKWPDAADTMAQVARIWFDAIDPNSVGFGRYLSEEANLREISGDHARAEDEFRHVLTVYERAKIKDSPAGWLVMGQLARCLISQGKPADAEPLLKEALAGLDSTVGRMGESNSIAVEYTRLLRGQNRMEEADAVEKSRPGLRAVVSGGAKSVTPPQLLSKREPEYSEIARRKRVSGQVLLYVEVSETGVAENIWVLRPLGVGLDQNAVSAVGKWKFRPGMKDGVPVRVSAQIEVFFRLL